MWVATSNNRVKHYYGENNAVRWVNRPGKVYLKDGSEFQLELYNPTQSKILAKFKLNGESIGSKGIVLRPGERVFLDRYIDTNRKFKFSTYNVDNTPTNRTAIQNNGKIRVDFYRESTVNENLNVWSPNTWTITGTFDTGGTYWYNDTSSTGTAFTNTALVSDTTDNYWSDTSIRSTNRSQVETGRIDKGGTSNQSFVNDNSSFSNWSFHTEHVDIFPYSSFDFTAGNIRTYCTNCGKRLKENWKYCSHCGQKV